MTATVNSTADVELVTPFIRAAESVFETMLRSDCRAHEIQPVQAGHQMYAVTSVIGLSGKMVGAISLSTHADGAIQILQRMAGLEAVDVDDFVRDAVGEIANMVAGQGKRELSRYELKLGLPQVIVGGDYAVYSPRWAHHSWVPLETDLGMLMLDVGFDSHAKA